MMGDGYASKRYETTGTAYYDVGFRTQMYVK